MVRVYIYACLCFVSSCFGADFFTHSFNEKDLQVYEVADDVSIRSSSYLDALLEKQKVLYRYKIWVKLFANCQHYRLTFMSTVESIKQNYRYELLAMEIFTLGEICQWGIVEELLKELQHYSQVAKGSTGDYIKMKNKVELLREYRGLKKVKIDGVFEPKISSLNKVLKWRLSSSDQVANMPIEKALVEVENLCR